MSKVHEVIRDEKHYGWMIFCPACECGHLFDGRWTFNGDMERPTFTPSMLCTGIYRCHSFVTDGKIRFLDDCTHPHKNKTMEIPEFHF